jgi:glycosyltransferase involved in cell wall biosynthesis
MHRKISLVCPFYNEENVIDSFYYSLSDVLSKIHNITFEVICIDDGSSDQTIEKLKKIQQKNNAYKIIELSRNFGKEAAITAGLDFATGDAVIPIDSDLQDPPALIPEMIEKWLEGAEVVLAKRVNRDSDSLLKRQTAKIFYKIFNHISTIQLIDNVGDYRLLDKVVVNAIKKLDERNRFMKGIFSWVGFKTEIIQYTRPKRLDGNSKFTPIKLWSLALDGITSFSTVPLKIWLYIGSSISLISFIYGSYIIYLTIVNKVSVPGYASILVSILFLGGLQLTGIGILGEYISRMFVETKKRPIYIIRCSYGIE